MFSAPSADPLMSRLEVITRWLEEVAKNTAGARAALEGGAGRGGTGKGTAADDPGTRWERATEALGRRFEGALQRWARTPVEKLVNASFDKATQVLGTATNTIIGQARGLAQRGMSGTVEQARLDYSMEQLGRQFAAIMAPLTNAMAYFASRLTGMMQGLNGGQQNRLMGMGIGAAIGSRFGPMGALAGGLAGSFLGGDTFEMGAGKGAAAGGLVGGRFAGLPGAYVGAAAGAALGSGSHIEGERPGDYYHRLRGSRDAGGEGASRAGAVFEMLSHSISVVAGGAARGVGIDTDMGRGRTRAEYDAAMAARRGGAPHRDVTPFQAEMGEAGSAYFRAQTGAIRATAGADFEDAGPLKPIVDGLIEIIKLLGKIAGVELREPPRGAGAVRG